MNLFAFLQGSSKKAHKRNAEDIFRTKDDVYIKLRDQCFRRVPQQQLDALEQAFRERITTTTPELSEPCYWTRQTLATLLDEEPNRIPNASEATVILWELLQALAAFPFPPKDHEDVLDIQECLHAFGLVRSGTIILHEPGYCLDPKGLRVIRQFRYRGRTEQIRFIFQALADVPPDEQAQPDETAVHGDRDEDVDLVDAMACGLDVAEDRNRWLANDFDKAVAQLPSSHSMRKLDWQLSHDKFALLSRLEDSIRDVGDNQNVKREAAEEVGPGTNGHASSDVSWPEFSRETEQRMPDMYKALAKYLHHVLASVVEKRRGRRFVFEKEKDPSRSPVAVRNADGKLVVVENVAG